MTGAAKQRLRSLAMQLDNTKSYFIYPSWAHFSYRWEDLPALFDAPLSSPYFKGWPNNWFEMGWSRQTKNFELVDGPFGNGIIVQDHSVMTDAKTKQSWLPAWILNREAIYEAPGMEVAPQGDPRHDLIRCLAPKETDEMKLGLQKKPKNYMPYLSLEPLNELKNSALVCITRTGSSALTEELETLPASLLGFDIKADLLSDENEPDVAKCEHINGFMRKWNLNGTWYFVDVTGHEIGLLFAVVAYMGCSLKYQIGRNVKSVHLVTALSGLPPLCSKWSMKRLR
jgi:hypothetical protein